MWVHKTVTIKGFSFSRTYESEIELDDNLNIIIDCTKKVIAIKRSATDVCIERYEDPRVSLTFSFDQGSALTIVSGNTTDGAILPPDQTAIVKVVMAGDGKTEVFINDVKTFASWVSMIQIYPEAVEVFKQ